MDTVTYCVATRFEQEDFKIYMNIQEIVLKSFASERCDTELAEVVKLHSGDSRKNWKPVGPNLSDLTMMSYASYGHVGSKFIGVIFVCVKSRKVLRGGLQYLRQAY